MRISDWSSDVCSADTGTVLSCAAAGRIIALASAAPQIPWSRRWRFRYVLAGPLIILFFPHPIRSRLPSHNLYKTNCVLGILPIDYKSNALSIANLWQGKDAARGGAGDRGGKAMRLISLDVLRGLTVAGMILVNSAAAMKYGAEANVAPILLQERKSTRLHSSH